MKGLKNRIRQKAYLRWILVLSNWAFQGIYHADSLEKIYKITFSIFFSLIFTIIIYYLIKLDFYISLFIGICFAHTLNWIVNNNLYSIIIHRLLITNLKKEAAFAYLDLLSERVKKNDSILYATVHGSISYGNLKPSSDIDIALVRKTGLLNGLKALWFFIKEQKIADLNKIPLELYLSDTPENAAKRFKSEQVPILISDYNIIISKYYSKTILISEAKSINGL